METRPPKSLMVYPGSCPDYMTHFPSCANDTEVRTKGFFFLADRGEPFYVFQRWPDNIICWTPNNRGDPRFMAAISLGLQPSARVNVIINASGTPTGHAA